jgi:hypothetical protein
VFATQPTVTVTSTDVTKTYGTDATAAVAAAFVTSGFVDASLHGGAFSQDTAANALTGSVTSAGSAPAASVAGSPYPTVVSFTSPTGYAVTNNPAGQVFVSRATLTVTANNQTKVYGDTLTFAGTEFSASGLQNGETIGSVTLASLGAAPTASVAGSPYAISASNATGGTFDAGNYSIGYVNGVLTLTPRPIAVVADNQTKVYGAPDPALTFAAPGLVNGDMLAGALARAPGETVPGSPYAITQGTVTNANNPNYTIAFTPAALTITPAALAIAANDAARPYGDANPAFGATFTGLANGDTPADVTGLAFSTAATIASNVGNYAITPVGAANPNYTITFTDGTLTISPAPLSIRADDASRLFGQPNPPFSATITGFRLGQGLADLTGTLLIETPATVASPPGAYAITPSGVSSPNYAVTFLNGTLAVTSVTAVPTAAPAPDTARDVALARSAALPPAAGAASGCGPESERGRVREIAPGLCVQRSEPR